MPSLISFMMASRHGVNFNEQDVWPGDLNAVLNGTVHALVFGFRVSKLVLPALTYTNRSSLIKRPLTTQMAIISSFRFAGSVRQALSCSVEKHCFSVTVLMPSPWLTPPSKGFDGKFLRPARIHSHCLTMVCHCKCGSLFVLRLGAGISLWLVLFWYLTGPSFSKLRFTSDNQVMAPVPCYIIFAFFYLALTVSATVFRLLFWFVWSYSSSPSFLVKP